MKLQDIPYARLSSQCISSATAMKPEEVVSSLGAVQAQDYKASLWAIGLRCRYGTTKSEVELAIAKRKIVRTWLMRGTLHSASSSDIRWMLKLFAPRLMRTAELRDKHLGLSEKIVGRTKALLLEALRGGKQLSRIEIYRILKKGGVPTTNNLGYHMLYRAALDGLICFGSYDGKQPTFALLDEWVPKIEKFSNEDAFEELTFRYFEGHGPATIQDYVWWSGLKVSDARRGIEKVSSKLIEEIIDGKIYYMSKTASRMRASESGTYLLPAFDEYLISYADRQAVLSNWQTQKILNSGKMIFVHSNGIFLPIIVIDGQTVGTWKSKVGNGKATVTLTPFIKLNKEQNREIKEAVERYGAFLETPTTFNIVR